MISSKKVLVSLLASVAALSLGPVASAQEAVSPDKVSAPSTATRVTAHAFVGGQANPPGILVGAGVDLRRRLSSAATPEDESAYFEGGAALTANPSYVAPAVHAEWSPGPFFSLRAEYELLGFMGNTRGILSFDARDARFGTSELDGRSVRSGFGHKVQVSPTFRFRLGPAIVQNRLDAAFYAYGGDGPVFYEVQHDTLIARGDVVLDWRTDIAFPLWHPGPDKALFVGPAYGLTRAVRTEVQRQRVGGAIVFKTADAWGMVRRPALFLDFGVNAEDRNRSGQPFVAFGLRAEM